MPEAHPEGPRLGSIEAGEPVEPRERAGPDAECQGVRGMGGVGPEPPAVPSAFGLVPIRFLKGLESHNGNRRPFTPVTPFPTLVVCSCQWAVEAKCAAFQRPPRGMEMLVVKSVYPEFSIALIFSFNSNAIPLDRWSAQSSNSSMYFLIGKMILLLISVFSLSG